MWIDSHCHLNDSSIVDLAALLAASKAEGITDFIVPATSLAEVPSLLEVCNNHGLYYALGVHPWFVDADITQLYDVLLAKVQQNQPVAIGEIGLDKIRGADLALQLEAFKCQLEIASATELPVIIHNVKASELVLECLALHPKLTGVIHGFTGSYEQAREFVKLGFKIGIGAAALQAGAKQMRLLTNLTLDDMLLETDMPFYKVAVDYIELLPAVARQIAIAQQVSIIDVAVATTNNAKQLFKLL